MVNGMPRLIKIFFHQQFAPVVRHALDLRVQHGMVDKAFCSAGCGQIHDHAAELVLVWVHIGGDMVDAFNALKRLGQPVAVPQVADHHFSRACLKAGFDLLGAVNHRSCPHLRIAPPKLPQDGLTGFPTRPSDQNHLHLLLLK